MTRTIKAGSDLKNRINKLEQNLYENNAVRQNALMGPQVVRMILDSLRFTAHLQGNHNVQDILKMQYYGDNDIFSYCIEMDDLFTDCPGWTDAQKRDLVLQHLDAGVRNPELRNHLDHFKGLAPFSIDEPEDPRYSYDGGS